MNNPSTQVARTRKPTIKHNEVLDFRQKNILLIAATNMTMFIDCHMVEALVDCKWQIAFTGS